MYQAAFSKAILKHEPAPPKELVDPEGRPVSRRFAVYRNNVFSGLIEAIEVGFPVVGTLLGEKLFRGVVGFYVGENPPSSPLIITYGAGFADALASLKKLSNYPYLPDLARLEYALRESYHMADKEPVSPEVLASFSVDELLEHRFKLAPSMRLIKSTWPIYDIWKKRAAPTGENEHQAQSVLVLRPDYDPTPHLLPVGTDVIVERLMMQETLADAIDGLEEADISSLLTLLIQEKAITEVFK